MTTISNHVDLILLFEIRFMVRYENEPLIKVTT